MTLPRSLLDESQIQEVKQLLWAGHHTQSEVARRFGVSQPTISRIYRGVDWADLPWPDGSRGHIPITRRATIHSSQNRKTRYQHDARAGHKELAPQEVTDINKVVENLLSAEDSKLRSVIERQAKSEGKRPRKGGKVGAGPNRTDMLPWPDIKEADPGHPTVKILVENDDPVLKVALRIVCAKVAQEEWQKPAALDMIETEAARIREKIT
jgi:hypothetical protein